MRPGDFSQLATAYAHRPAYAPEVIDMLAALAQRGRANARAADIGAGTGKLTAMLDARGLSGWAVEPNAAMRAEGEGLGLERFSWVEGAAEATGLSDESVDWVTMASAFHWTDPDVALKEFHRILRPNGRLTLLWNPRDLERDRLQARIEARIAELAPQIERRSSGAGAYTRELEDKLTDSGYFRDVIQIEAAHAETMSRERHMGAWRSVNDVRAQAGEETFAQILKAIEQEIGGARTLKVIYRTRSWTATKV